MYKLPHVTAIISEYNPFHNGHFYQIENIKKNHRDGYIISVMSSNFTQRAEPSIISKWARAKSALSCGVDLVVELPVIWSMSSAKNFAKAAVFLVNALGIVDSLNFGCETANIEVLQKVAQLLSTDKFDSRLKKFLNQGLSYPKARYNTLKQITSDNMHCVLNGANNILAIEYLIALRNLNSKIIPEPLKRKDVPHDSNIIVNNIASASYIRKKILEDKLDYIKKFVPIKSYEILKKEASDNKIASLYNLDRAILSKLRCMNPEDFYMINDVSEGLQNRIYEKIQTATSINQLFDQIKTKRYTHSRIRRIILSAFLEIDSELIKTDPLYIKILGFTKRGQLILSHLKDKCLLPLVTKPKEILELNPAASRIFEVENKASNLYALSTKDVQPCNAEFLSQIIKI